MSPEQARGKALDKRTDIWAFGCVLYEMLTGHRAFAGETFSDTIVAILEREPDWTRLPTGTPSAVRRLMQRCLEKDPRRRLRDIGDARHSIEDVATGEPDVRAAPSPYPRRLAWLLGGVALASASVASWLLWGATTEAPSRNVQLQRLTDLVGIEESPAISPDGKEVAFVARAGSKRQIWRRLLAGGAPLQITRDDTDHEQPRWVPDSSALIYYVPSATPGEHGAIWEVPALGGEPRRIASALSSGDISHDGRRIALFRFEKTQIALVVVNRDGSGTDHLRPLPPKSSFEYPRWSPDDRWIAFHQDNLGSGFDERVLVVPDHAGRRSARDRAECSLEGSLMVTKRRGCRLQLLLRQHCALSTDVQPAIGRARQHGGPPAHVRGPVLRGARRTHVRHVGSEPDPDAVGHLEISGQWVAGREHARAESTSHIRPATRRPLRSARMNRKWSTCPTLAATGTCG